MIDLSEIPTELLEQELNKRKRAARELREKQRHEKVCCRNCAHRMYGKSTFSSNIMEDTWVCRKRPKTPTNVFERVPDYNKAYYVCTRQYDGCEMFLHKDSEEGRKEVKKNRKLSLRVID